MNPPTTKSLTQLQQQAKMTKHIRASLNDAIHSQRYNVYSPYMSHDLEIQESLYKILYREHPHIFKLIFDDIGETKSEYVDYEQFEYSNFDYSITH